MTVGERIRFYRERAGLTQEELAAMIGTSSQAIYKYEKGVVYNIPLKKIEKLAEIFNVEPDNITGWKDAAKKQLSTNDYSDQEQSIIQKYRALDERGKRVVDSVIDVESNFIKSTPDDEDDSKMIKLKLTKIIPLFENSFAAGPAEPDFGGQWTDYEVPADSPADFAIKVNGDSMEPYLVDGSIALCTKNRLKIGDIGAFLLDGEYLVKQYVEDAFGNAYLLSLNRERSDADITIRHDSGRSLMCFGKVMMRKKVPLVQI